MFTAKTVRIWYKIHKWTSLICTAFLLLLCLTGLPLIFHHEIDHLLGHDVEPPALPAGTQRVTLEKIIESGRAQYPNLFLQYVVWDEDQPDGLSLILAPALSKDAERVQKVDARTGHVLSEPKVQEGFMYIMLQLHVEMFAGLGGKLFLGVMGLLFALSVISGVVVYGPFMRKLEFGTVRKERGPRLKWFDLHNLLGIATVVWALVVGITGSINTWSDLALGYWQGDQLAAMTAPYQGKPPVERLSSLDEALKEALRATPGKEPGFVAFPGTPFTSPHHYAFFMRGKTPLTARLYAAVLVDAETGRLTDSRTLPWYITAILISQPLHFGDYGGIPLKIIWTLFDIVTILVLGSGLYLWISRKKAPIEVQLDALVEAEALEKMA